MCKARGLLQHCLQQHLSVLSQVVRRPPCPVPLADPLCPLPLSLPSQAFPCSCAGFWAHTAHGGSAPLCRVAVLHSYPKGAGERLELSLSRGHAAGRAAWGAWCHPQHYQPCSKGCQTPKITLGIVLAASLQCGIAPESCCSCSCLIPAECWHREEGRVRSG